MTNRETQKGFVLIVMAAASIAVIGALGLAVDMGRVFIIKNETQNFCDSAALAAALQLDGTSAGVTLAKSTATSLTDNWNFGTTTVSSPTIEFATTSTGTWTNAPPNPPTDYIYVRVKSSVSVPLYFAPVVMPVKVYNQTVNSQSIAGQTPVTTLNTGLSPYSAIAQDNTVSTLGLVKGQEYMIQQAHCCQTGGNGNNACGPPNSSQGSPINCFSGTICNDDSDVALWQVKQVWSASLSGYWGYTSNSLIRSAILDLIQLQPVGICPWSTFSTTISSCAAATNIEPSLSSGQKQQQGIDLDERANQDSYNLTAGGSGTGNSKKHPTVDAATTWTNYQTAQANGTTNGRRLLTAPVVWPVNATQTTVASYGLFLLETNVYSGVGTSSYYQSAGGGNDAFCAIYAGPPVLGGRKAGGSSSPGAFEVKLVS
jgi:hypothetical protein